MAESRDKMPVATGHGQLRASHADREQVISSLKAAFVQGRLTKDEFDLRVGQTFASRTYAELAAVTADLPAGPAAAQSGRPARARRGARVLRPGTAVVAANVLYAGMWPLAAFLPRGFELVVLTGVGYLVVIVAVLAWWRVLESRRDKHSGGQRPRRRAPGAAAVRRQAPRLPSARECEFGVSLSLCLPSGGV